MDASILTFRIATAALALAMPAASADECADYRAVIDAARNAEEHLAPPDELDLDAFDGAASAVQAARAIDRRARRALLDAVMTAATAEELYAAHRTELHARAAWRSFKAVHEVLYLGYCALGSARP